MKTKSILIGLMILLSLNFISFTSAIVVDADYITYYPGESKSFDIEVENNENFDIEDVSISLLLNEIPFTSVGSSEKDADDIDEDDDESVSFTLRPSTDITPGDYNIPYVITYKNSDTEEFETKNGSFGLRVSAKTELDYAVETKNNILEKQGTVQVRIINRGLGEIKFVSIEILDKQGFELISPDKVYLGSIDSDDSDFASFDVIFKNKNPNLKVNLKYKDFENQDQIQVLSFPIEVYSQEEAIELGLIQKSNTSLYIGIVLGIIVLWFFWRRYKKYQKEKKRKEKSGE